MKMNEILNGFNANINNETTYLLISAIEKRKVPPQVMDRVVSDLEPKPEREEVMNNIQKGSLN